jgi:hypothetical protein
MRLHTETLELLSVGRTKQAERIMLESHDRKSKGIFVTSISRNERFTVKAKGTQGIVIIAVDFNFCRFGTMTAKK